MTKDVKEFETLISDGLIWAATENKFFQELKVDLDVLQQHVQSIDDEVNVKGIKAALRSFRLLSKSETRLNRYLQTVEEVMRRAKEKVQFSGTLHDAEEVLRRLEIETKTLISNGSRYDGKIVQLLNTLQNEIKNHEIEKAHQVLGELLEIVDNGTKWLAALESDLKKAKEMSSLFFGMSSFRTIDDIKTEARRFSRYPELYPSCSSVLDVYGYIYETTQRNPRFSNLSSEVVADLEELMIETADSSNDQNDLVKLIDLFEGCGKWKKAAKMCLMYARKHTRIVGTSSRHSYIKGKISTQQANMDALIQMDRRRELEAIPYYQKAATILQDKTELKQEGAELLQGIGSTLNVYESWRELIQRLIREL